MKPDREIHQLASDVVDQIAAGEVVERPAHLVKELVENALDAGSTVIEIEYDQGGRRVRVSDNGSGIKADQIQLALARHATSKITAADDLYKLSSFGFRGEALASIAAVSRLTLQSKTKGDETASQIVSKFGEQSSVERVGGNIGTTVLIEELFANIPARLKFLKSEAGETAQIKATLRALALANENVEFRLKSKGKLEQVWPIAARFLDRARQILETDPLYVCESSYGEAKAQVVFASPHDITGNARGIQIFVQGRWVQDRSLQAAVIEAYRGLLMHGEYPIAVVRLQVPPETVDVNIHPSKSQVKFSDPQTAFRAINRGLREALEKAPWLVTSRAGGEASGAEKAGSVAQAVQNYSREASKLTIADLTRPYQAQASPRSDVTSPDFAQTPVHSIARFEAPEFNSVVFKQKTDLANFSSASAKTEAEAATDAATGAGAETDTGTAPTYSQGTGPWSKLQVLAQAHLTYIVTQDVDRLVLVDQHAAHERVAYERLMRAWFKGEAEVQNLLLPINVELDPDGTEALLSIASELEKLGIRFDQIGPQTVAVRAVPVAIKEAALVKALKDLSREIVDRGGSFAFEKRISDLCASMACHSVVRAGQALSTEQMKSLLKQMDEFPLSSFCPHGRPVSVDYPFARLERDFGRIK